MKPINMQTKYTTRNGREVEIRSTTGTGLDTYPVIGQIKGELGAATWTSAGKNMIGHSSVHDLIEAVEANPRNFGDMTDADKGALLLAQREGKELQFFSGVYNGWKSRSQHCYENRLFDSNAYRIAPTRVNGTVEVDAYGKPDFETWVAS